MFLRLEFIKDRSEWAKTQFSDLEVGDVIRLVERAWDEAMNRQEKTNRIVALMVPEIIRA